MFTSALAFFSTFRLHMILAGIGLLLALALTVVIITDVRHREHLAVQIEKQRNQIEQLNARSCRPTRGTPLPPVRPFWAR